MSRRRFRLALGLIALGALGARLYYALHVMGDHRFAGDAIEFHFLGQTLADKHAYLQPFPLYDPGTLVPRQTNLEPFVTGHTRISTAEKPPLFPAYLALWVKLGLSSFRWNMVASSLLGTGTVVTVGLIARRVGGVRVALVAAAVAALYPGLVLLDGSVRSESLYVLLVALAVLAAYRLVDRPSPWRAAVVGVALGLAALTRAEAVLLLVLLAAPAVWLAPHHLSRRERLRLLAAVLAGCAVLVVPWLARNWIVFDRPTPISTNQGGLLAGANCDRAYHGPLIGAWGCFPQPPASWGKNESVISGRLQSQALDYASDHAGRVPAVAGVRLLRTWELWKPEESVQFEAVIGDRNVRFNRIAQRCLYVLALLAVAGAVVLRRRGEPLRLLLALPVLVSVVSVASYGSTRFRAAAEVAIVVLAAVALDLVGARTAAWAADRRARSRDETTS
jgi:4-amino-4-deoxy-L-arabinose transferase-like glycosyltransferase